jgi:hypothetical protein
MMTRVEPIDGITLKLQAGFAQGVTEGAQFAIYQHYINDPQNNPCLASLQVTAVQTFYSILAVGDNLKLEPGKPAYARQVRSGRGHDLRVYVYPELYEKLQGDQHWQETFLSRDADFVARPTADQFTAHISMNLEDNKVTFDTRHALSNKHGITRLPHTVYPDSKQILPVLCSAAAWNWHISRENPDHPFKGKLDIEFFRVKEDLARWNSDGRHPLNQDGDNLNTSGVVDILAEPSHLYGFKVVNHTSHDLYPYLFYFDASKLSIGESPRLDTYYPSICISLEHYYLGAIPGAGKIDAPLSPNDSLTLGYGSSGTIPFAYRLEDNQTFDVGIIKLFVTTSPINFGLLEQDSPFDEGGRGNERKVTIRSRLANVELWDTRDMILVQHRALPTPAYNLDSLFSSELPPPHVGHDMAPAPAPEPPVVLIPKAQTGGVLEGKYGLWVVVPFVVALSCVPFMLFYVFVLP